MKFETIKTPQSEVSLHKKALKYALLKDYEREKQRNRSILKGGEIFMKHKLITISLTGFLALVLLFGYAYVGNNTFTPRAEAQEAVEKAFDKFRMLSPEERARLEEKIKDDMESSLQEAKNAKDLVIVPENEITRFTPPTEAEGQPLFAMKSEKAIRVKGSDGDVNVEDGKAVPGVRIAEEPGKIMAPHNLKVLRYTDPNGRQVILGINEKDEAVMKLIKIDNKQLQQLKEAKVVRPNAE